MKKIVLIEYVDLGLPSGTKWKTVNEKGYFDYDEAVTIFGEELPSTEQWEELMEKCKWVWVGGYVDIEFGYYVVGPNGKRIFLPAAGGSGSEGVGDVGTRGLYWSTPLSGSDYAWGLFFDSGDVDLLGFNPRGGGMSVRLVKK